MYALVQLRSAKFYFTFALVLQHPRCSLSYLVQWRDGEVRYGLWTLWPPWFGCISSVFGYALEACLPPICAVHVMMWLQCCRCPGTAQNYAGHLKLYSLTQEQFWLRVSLALGLFLTSVYMFNAFSLFIRCSVVHLLVQTPWFRHFCCVDGNGPS